MGIKHIFILLFIIIILDAQYQLPIRKYYTDEINFFKSKAKWVLNFGTDLQTFFDVMGF